MKTIREDKNWKIKQLEIKVDELEEKLAEQKKEHDIYCDELVKQNDMVLKRTLKEMADDIINVVKNEEDWLEMHKIESKFESGKSVGVARALVLVETVINKYLK